MSTLISFQLVTRAQLEAIYTTWGVMDDLETTLHVNNPLSPWTHWENVRKES